jgi:hypothetical protein
MIERIRDLAQVCVEETSYCYYHTRAAGRWGRFSSAQCLLARARGSREQHGKGPRSHLVLKDEGTKVGTIVDGNKLRGESVTLYDDAHHFRLGALAAQFR